MDYFSSDVKVPRLFFFQRVLKKRDAKPVLITMLLNMDVRVGPKLGHIGPKWENILTWGELFKINSVT